MCSCYFCVLLHEIKYFAKKNCEIAFVRHLGYVVEWSEFYLFLLQLTFLANVMWAHAWPCIFILLSRKKNDIKIHFARIYMLTCHLRIGLLPFIAYTHAKHPFFLKPNDKHFSCHMFCIWLTFLSKITPT